MKGKYYFYDFNGDQTKGLTCQTRIVSEIRLPAHNKKFRKACICPSDVSRIPRYEKGEIVNVLIGDPRVLIDVKVVSFSKKDVPQKFHRIQFAGNTIVTLEYKGKKIWVDDNHVCLLRKVQKLLEKIGKESEQ